MLMTTDFTSDKPKIAQNKVLKLSSILEELRKRNCEISTFNRMKLDCWSDDTHVVNALLCFTPR